MKIPAETAALLEDYFDGIYVITLERAVDRQQQVAKRLNGLNFTFFYGVDKQQLSLPQLISDNIYNEEEAKRLNRYGKGMVLGHVACALSHRKLYEHILEKGHKRVLIFEDDAVPYYDSLINISHPLEELPHDWEMVYFGYAKNEEATPKLKRKQNFYMALSHLKLLKWSPLMVKNLLPKLFSPHLRRAGFHDLLHAYGVTDTACKKLIAAQTPVVFNSDPLVSHLIMNGILNAFITTEQFFTQEQFIDESHRSFIHHL
ncbi:MAG: glycosyltransferase family 25 protein [Sphingobacteriales bacterium]|nr:glycosyltransferase family 25 protein [Sphingobacteriales bacterium]